MSKWDKRHTANICYAEDTCGTVLNDILRIICISLGLILIVGAVRELSLIIIRTWLDFYQHIQDVC